MYPSIQFLLVKKTVRHFGKNLSTADTSKIEKCLKMIRFGMKNTLVTFIDKYYEYGGETTGEKRGLTIGGYESAWLADLVASCILEETKDIFSDFIYYRIYRNDGFVILKGIKIKREINKWLESFQNKVDKLAESD